MERKEQSIIVFMLFLLSVGLSHADYTNLYPVSFTIPFATDFVYNTNPQPCSAWSMLQTRLEISGTQSQIQNVSNTMQAAGNVKDNLGHQAFITLSRAVDYQRNVIYFYDGTGLDFGSAIGDAATLKGSCTAQYRVRTGNQIISNACMSYGYDNCVGVPVVSNVSSITKPKACFITQLCNTGIQQVVSAYEVSGQNAVCEEDIRHDTYTSDLSVCRRLQNGSCGTLQMQGGSLQCAGTVSRTVPLPASGSSQGDPFSSFIDSIIGFIKSLFGLK